LRPIHLLRAAILVSSTVVLGLVTFMVGIFERDAKVAYGVALLWVRLNLWASGARVNASGLDGLDRARSYVFMANHESNADIVAIAWALRDFQLRWVAKKELVRVPVFGWALRALKNIVIDRTDREAAIRSYRAARERIERGISVMVFPEGTRGPGKSLLPFKKGGFVLAIETGTPIVPIGVRGTRAVMARKGWRIDAGDVELRFGRPIETADRSLADRNRLIAEVRQAIEALRAS
jgi:1-acyl-sn-glycerol-3-phosphate acyltransferase